MRSPTLTQLTAMSMLATTLSAAVPSHAHAAEPPARPKSPPVQQVDPETLEFTSPVLKQRLDAFLKQVGAQDQTRQSDSLTVKEWPYFLMLEGRKYRRTKVSYHATWRQALEPDADWRPLTTAAIRPQRTYQLGLTPLRDDRQRIQRIAINGTYAPPRNGWAARVEYELTAHGDERNESVLILFKHHSDELRASDWHFRVPANGVAGSYRAEGSDIKLVARASLPHSRYRQKLFGGAMATAKELRHLELNLCDDLEAELRNTIETGRINLIDYSNVRRDNPPRELPANPGGEDLTDGEKAALLADGLARINLRRQRWRDHADELHAAVRKAFPLLNDWGDKQP